MSKEPTDATDERPANMHIRVHTLGRFQLEWVDPLSGQITPLPPERLRGQNAATSLGLLKALLTRPDRFATRAWLLEQFWPDSRHRSAEERLTDVVSSLRGLLRPKGSADMLVHFVHGVDGRGVGLRLDPYPHLWCDADAFEWYVRHGLLLDQRGEDSTACWERAYQLAERGVYLSEQIEADWTRQRRDHLNGLLRDCVQRWTQILREAGQVGEAIMRLRSYWLERPTEQDALRPLLELLGERERFQEAEECYEKARATLAEDGHVPDGRTDEAIEVVRALRVQRKPGTRQTKEIPGYSDMLFPPSPPQPKHLLSPFSLAVAQDIIETSHDLEGTTLDLSRRHLFQQALPLLLGVASTGFALPDGVLQASLMVSQAFLSGLNDLRFPLADEETIAHFEQLNDTLWCLVNDNQTKTVIRILASYLPQMASFAKEPSPNQKRIACLVASGYILAAEAEKENVSSLEKYCRQAITYSQLAENDMIQVDALRQSATISLIEKRPLKSLLFYQQAIPLIDRVSPLLRSRIYLGLALAQARCQHTQPALDALEMAHEHYPSQPENDPAFRYLAPSSSISALHLYEALTYTDLHQPESAWDALLQVDGIHPKVPTTESTRLEFLNLQAKTAASLGDLEKSCFYLQQSIQAAKTGGYHIWQEEAYDVQLFLQQIWPDEKVVKNLSQLFQEG